MPLYRHMHVSPVNPHFPGSFSPSLYPQRSPGLPAATHIRWILLEILPLVSPCLLITLGRSKAEIPRFLDPETLQSEGTHSRPRSHELNTDRAHIHN